MIEERSIRLLDALEGRADTLLGLWKKERESRLVLQRRLAEGEAARLALEEQHRELEARHLALVEERRELAEENRELIRQSRELEEHNRRLRERLSGEHDGQGASGFGGPARRSRGLSALIGRATPNAASSADDDAGARPDGGPTTRRSEPAEQPEPSAESTEAPERSAEASAPPSPQALLAEWYRRYPSVFFRGHTRPLKVGIHEALVESEPWPEKLVRRALACYVNLPRYLKAVREGAERIDLQGQPAGSVDAQAAEHARQKLERLRAERRGKARPVSKARNSPAQPGAVPGQKVDAGRGKPGPGAKPEARLAGKKKPAAEGQTAKPSAAKPRPAAETRPVTMEEKLAALVAKHRHT